MIQVQIAATLEADGVCGSRWVLVDPSDTAASASAPTAAGGAPAVPDVVPDAISERSPRVATVKRTPLTLQVLSAVVLLAALAGAWWLASSVLEARGAGKPAGAAAAAARAG